MKNTLALIAALSLVASTSAFAAPSDSIDTGAAAAVKTDAAANDSTITKGDAMKAKETKTVKTTVKTTDKEEAAVDSKTDKKAADKAAKAAPAYGESTKQ